MADPVYIAIDLKSFYASVECMDRGLDPLHTNLVVADESRTDKTICLAVSPALKAIGVPARPRLFEVKEVIREQNYRRKRRAPGQILTGESVDDRELKASPQLAIGYITAVPRMKRYMEYSARIYQLYLKYIAPGDIHVYSIDEVFIDATPYVKMYGMSAHELAMMLVREVLHASGVTATAGIGTNLYLCKIAMDIVAKKMPADKDGVRVAELDEMSYRRQLWSHRPLTDFWRIGSGYARKLEGHGLFTMGDIARMSLRNEDLLYQMFGINAELLIDHAWGWEPCTMAEIKSYVPSANSVSSGQVLAEPYDAERAKLVIREMTDFLTIDLVEKGLLTRQIVLTIGYDVRNLMDEAILKQYSGAVRADHYGRLIPRHAHGSVNLGRYTASTGQILKAVSELYDRIIDTRLWIRRLNVTAADVIREEAAGSTEAVTQQLDLFTDYEMERAGQEQIRKKQEREKKGQKAILSIRRKYGKNAILRGTDYREGATQKDRNDQVGGHKG